MNEIEESVKAGREFFHRTLALQSPHAISHTYKHLIAIEEAGYADLLVVRDLRDELVQRSKKPTSSCLLRTNHSNSSIQFRWREG